MKSKLVCFSPGGEQLAHSGPDGVLRIWDTNSGLLLHEYQPAEHLKATTSCIQYSKKKQGHNLLAMGTLSGTIFIYSPEEKEVKTVFEHSSNQPVMDIAWCDSNLLVSIARDNTIAYWDVASGEKEVLDEVCEGTAICVFNKKNLAFGNRGITVISHTKSGKKKTKSYVAHNSSITQLLPIKLEDSSKMFLSSSVDDRYIYAWAVKNKSEQSLCSFMVKETVTNMSAGKLSNDTLALAVSTTKGSLLLFKHHLNGNSKGKPVKYSGSLKILSKSSSKIIPIVASYFCEDKDNSIIIVYCRSSVFTFERVAIDKLTGNLEFQRDEPTSTKELSLLKTVVPEVPDDATFSGPMDTAVVANVQEKRKRKSSLNVASLPMEERLNVLALDSTGSKDYGKKIGIDDCAQLLLQGLHSKDKTILDSVFSQGDVKSMNRTVRRLPVQAVVPLIQELSPRIIEKGYRTPQQVKWLRALLYYHMSHLTTIPERKELMEPFLNLSTIRMSTFPQVAQLHSRLDLMLSHVAVRQDVKQNENKNEAEALLVYKDESSDEDDMLDLVGGGVSESEDNWELSDIDEMNGASEEESDMEVDQHLNTVKRKHDTELVNGDVESSDDEEEEDDNDDDDDKSDKDIERSSEDGDDVSDIEVNGDGDNDSDDSG